MDWLFVGPESLFFPAFLLDDWGNEIKGLKLYRWLREEGNEFPRAEVFGFGHNGEKQQRFARELEIYDTPRCVAFESREAALESGYPISRVLRWAEKGEPAGSTQRPTERGLPMKRAKLPWFAVTPASLEADGYAIPSSQNEQEP